VLARCGQYEQAAANPETQPRALANVAQALARVGKYQQATDIAMQAEAIAHGSDCQTGTPAEISGALVQDRQQQAMTNTPSAQVEAITRTIPNAREQEIVLAGVAGALAWSGKHEQAQAIADAITGGYYGVRQSL
jgi:hypothetical protein